MRPTLMTHPDGNFVDGLLPPILASWLNGNGSGKKEKNKSPQDGA